MRGGSEIENLDREMGNQARMEIVSVRVRQFDQRTFRSAAVSRRASGRVLAGLLLVALACMACDPGVGVSARNETDQALVVREGATQWSLPAHSSGRVFAQLGSPESVPPRDYDLLDAATCTVLATEHVIYPLAVRWAVEGRLRVERGVVRQRDGALQLLIAA